MTKTTCLFVSILMLITGCNERQRAATTAPPPAVSDAAPDPAAAARAVLAARRAAQLEQLHDYWVAGDFPVNPTTRTLNIFRDAHGGLCAIANLVYQGGYHALLEQTVRDDNFVALRDVHDGPLHDWLLGSGLTHEEIVLVQGIGYQGMGLRFELETAEDVELRIARQTELLQTRLAAAEQQLRAGTEASLDLAVARQLADRAGRQAAAGRLAGAGRLVVADFQAVDPAVRSLEVAPAAR